MWSPKEKSLKRKNDLNKRGEYWNFNDGQGFVKDLADRAANVAPLMKITRDDITNKVRAIQGPPKQPEVSPMVPYHFICYLSFSTNADSSVSPSLNSQRTNVENPLDVLANQAVQILQTTRHAIKSMQPTILN
jgi:hypothetical protein